MISEDILNKIRPGVKIRVSERIPAYITSAGGKGKKKDDKAASKGGERISSFEGLVLARKHGGEIGATFTVRATVAGVGMEKIYPINSPLLNKVEILSQPKKTHRAKLYYLRNISAKKTRKKIGAEK
ncbi:MAG TPA: 50S ribosomal protein L19 [Candidatus Paceibacterota bacterium]